MDSDWKKQASCKFTSEQEDFFDTRESHLKILSKKYCSKCPVKNHCLYVSLINEDPYGLWGAFTPKERNYYIRKIYDYAKSISVPTNDWTKELDEIFKLFSTQAKIEEYFYN